MRAFRFITMLLLVITMTSGCDFFRSILGKPTSKDIERMKIEAEQQARKQRQQDSLKKAAALQQQLEQQAEKASEPVLSRLDKRYYVILGSFKVEDNARNLMAALKKDGYDAQRISFKNGFEVISVLATDSFDEAREILKKLRYLPYLHYPDDAWIYDSTNNLHK